MSGGTAQRIENVVDAIAAAALACAVLVCASKLGLPLLLAAGWAVLICLLSFWLLGSIGSKRADFPVKDFPPAAFHPDPPELLLEDLLGAVDENSRVVRLFDPPATIPAAPPDASEALYDALAQLRRSVRDR